MNRNYANTPWDSDKIDTLKILWAAGDSAAVIAKVLGADFTRNSVMGKVWRLRLPPHMPERRKEYTPPEPVDDRDIPIAQRRTLLELTKDCCRWPVGDPRDAVGSFFCGGKVHGKKSYCEGHWRRSIQIRSETRRPFIFKGHKPKKVTE